jgi:hypothetical protein
MSIPNRRPARPRIARGGPWCKHPVPPAPTPCRGSAVSRAGLHSWCSQRCPSIDVRAARPLPALDCSFAFGPVLPAPGSRSALAVSHGFGGFLRACGAGLLRPAADHGVHLVSGCSRPLAPNVARPKPGFTGEVRAVSIPGDQEAAGTTALRRGMPDESGPVGDGLCGASEEEPSSPAWSRRTSVRSGPEGPDRCR